MSGIDELTRVRRRAVDLCLDLVAVVDTLEPELLDQLVGRLLVLTEAVTPTHRGHAARLTETENP